MSDANLRTFKELCNGKVWVAVEGMITGLKEQSERDDFEVFMSTFGEAGSDGICFGCAATCTVQKLSKVNLTAQNISDDLRAKTLGAREEDLHLFETAINDFRLGVLSTLFQYMDAPPSAFPAEKFEQYKHSFTLRTRNWREQLPKVEALAKLLKEADV